MNIGYIDLYLIHDPQGEKLVETYKTLLKYKDRGLIKYNNDILLTLFL